MTETEWLHCTDPSTMLEHIARTWFSFRQRLVTLLPFAHRRYTARLRKLHLFGTALWRSLYYFRRPFPPQVHVIEVLERYVDGLASERDLEEARLAAAAILDDSLVELTIITGPSPFEPDSYYHPDMVPLWVTGDIDRTINKVLYVVLDQLRKELIYRPESLRLLYPSQDLTVPGYACVLLRDILGNPFSSLPSLLFHLAITHPPLRSLARSIYQGRLFADLPVLADALEEVGCTELTILEHCRKGLLHVPGCWVLDSLISQTLP